MIISKAPLRISFVGGGTDYPSYFKEHGGAVISTAINWNIYVTASLFPENLHGHRHKFFYNKIESPQDLISISHPILKEILSHFKDPLPLELHSISDVPSKTGLGSSSTFTVAALAAVSRLINNSESSKEFLLNNAIDIEQNKLNQIVGSQDQAIAVHGGFNKFLFNKDGSIVCEKINISNEKLNKLESSMYLVYTGGARQTLEQRNPYKKLDKKIEDINLEIFSHVSLFEEAINDDMNLFKIGKLLSRNWELKKQISSEVFNDNINSLYDFGIASGALGGKLLGAGGGGFFLFIVEEKNRNNFENALRNKAPFYQPKINESGVSTFKI